MAVPRVPILVGVLVLAGAGIAWITMRDRAPASRPDVPRGSASPPIARGAVYAPEGPSLGAGSGDPTTAPALAAIAEDPAQPETRPLAPPVALSPQAFAAQERDVSWAGDTEAAIRRKLAPLSIPLDRVECRHDLCELTVAGAAEAVNDALAKLDQPGALSSLARSMLLTAPVQDAGRLTIRAYALFDR